MALLEPPRLADDASNTAHRSAKMISPPDCNRSSADMDDPSKPHGCLFVVDQIRKAEDMFRQINALLPKQAVWTSDQKPTQMYAPKPPPELGSVLRCSCVKPWLPFEPLLVPRRATKMKEKTGMSTKHHRSHANANSAANTSSILSGPLVGGPEGILLLFGFLKSARA